MHSVLLDTSFCIRLLKKDDEFHQNAIEYFEYFLENKIEMFISSISIAEYAVRDDPRHLPLKTMQIIPFDYLDGVKAGECLNAVWELRGQKREGERDLVKDDCKLIAQICRRKIEGFITKDHRSLQQFVRPISERMQHQIIFIDLTIPVKIFVGLLF